MAEAVLGDVVAQSQNQRRVDLVEVSQRLRQRFRRRRRNLANQQLLLELGGAGDQLAAGAGDQALAVEDQLVLAADQVAEGELGAVGARALGEHLLPLAALAAVVGGAGGVGDQRRPFLGLGRGRRARRPDVLADRQPDPLPAGLDRSAARCPGRSSAARRRPRSWAACSCGRRRARRRRRGRRASCGRGGSRRGRRPARRSRPARSCRRPRGPAPRPRAGWPRRSAASGRGPRRGSRAGRAPGRSSARRRRRRSGRSTRRSWRRCRRRRRRWGRSGRGLCASRCPVSDGQWTSIAVEARGAGRGGRYASVDAGPPSPVGRFLGGCALAPCRRAGRCLGLDRARRGRSQPRLAEPEAVHRPEAAADRSPRAADRQPRPQPQRLHGAAGAALAQAAGGTSACTGWRRASTRRT